MTGPPVINRAPSPAAHFKRGLGEGKEVQFTDCCDLEGLAGGMGGRGLDGYRVENLHYHPLPPPPLRHETPGARDRA